MASNTALKFYRQSTQPTGVKGAIWFNTSNQTIQIYTGTKWEVYTGLVNATYDSATGIFEITKHDDSKITLNFSDCASKKALEALIKTVSDNHAAALKAAGDAAGVASAAQKAIDDHKKAYADKVAEYDKAISETIPGRFTPLETAVNTTIPGQISGINGTLSNLNAATAVDGAIDKRVDSKIGQAIEDLVDGFSDETKTSAKSEGIQVSVAQADGSVTGVTVDASDLTETLRVIRDSVSTVSNKIGEGYDATNTVAKAVKDAKDAADAAQADVDALVGDKKNADGTPKSVVTIATEVITDLLAIDTEDSDEAKTLEELIAWLNEHPADALDMNQAITDLKSYNTNTVAAAVTKINAVYAKYVAEVAKGNSGTYVSHSVTKEDLTDGDKVTIAIDDTALVQKIGEMERAIEAASNAGVTSFAGQTGAIKVDTAATANGSVKFSMNASNKTLSATVAGLGSAAYTNSDAYATSAQGDNADSALQSISVKDGNSDYVEITAKNANTQTVGLKVAAIGTKGVADAAAVKTYVDNAVAAAMTWVEFE